MTIKWVFVVMLFTLLGSIGGFFFKRASANGLEISKYFMTQLFIGGAFYGTGAILNIITLRYLPYTVVFPLTSITYVWTFLLSYFFLKEVISLRKIIGVGLIIAGSFFLIM
ncbi:EamA family transporter [Pontibacillus salicampi]|uniref:EamA family transporter n=1 Tax=Pontibacillus salicampi TaxID=1449801 RepID=A0ABV6LSB5_9BACI